MVTPTFAVAPPPPPVYSMFPERTTRGSFSLAHVPTTAYHSAPPAATTVATTTTRTQEEDHKITSLGFRGWGLHRRQLSLLPGPDITCAEAVLFGMFVFCSRGFESDAAKDVAIAPARTEASKAAIELGQNLARSRC